MNNWKKLEDELPTGDEYAVLLFPCKTDCMLLYTVSNPQYAKKTALDHGYTHWCEFNLAPDHKALEEWQNNITREEIEKSMGTTI